MKQAVAYSQLDNWGPIFIHSCSLKEIDNALHEYMNIAPHAIIKLATLLVGNI